MHIFLQKKYILIVSVLLILLVSFLFYTKKSFAPIERKNAPLEDITFDLPVITSLSFPEKECLITSYGAKSDEITDNTEAIRRAIADCSSKGGGKVVVPNGNFLTGPIVLKNNINLFLEKDARINFSREFSHYLPVVFTRFEGLELYNYSPLIYAFDAHNIAITGEGTINGNGDAWWEWKNRQGTAIKKLYDLTLTNTPPQKRIFGTEEDAIRPSFIEFVRSKDILLNGVTFINSPAWSIHPLYSENIHIQNIKVDSDGPNTDGIVIDSSRNVIVEKNFINSGDDAIVIKSGKDADGLRVNEPSENIVIRDNTIKNGHSGFAIGSEMSGSVRNVLFEDNTIDRVDFGLQIKSMRGRGGIVENIWMRNIDIRRTSKHTILVDMQYGTPIDPPSPLLPVFRNISFQNISCKRTGNALMFRGLEESKIQDIHLNNITISAKENIQPENIETLKQENVVITILPKEPKK